MPSGDRVNCCGLKRVLFLSWAIKGATSWDLPSVASLNKKRAEGAFASSGIVDNFGRDEIVILDLGAQEIGQTDGIGLGTGGDLNFSNEMLRDQHTDVVTKVGF